MKCIVCNGNHFGELGIQRKELQYRKCLSCGLLTLNPVPDTDELKIFYGDDYGDFLIKNGENFFDLMKKCLDDIDFVNYKTTGQKRFLDIGSSTGHLLNYIKELGYETVGIEPCKKAADYSVKEFKLKIYKNPIEEIDFKDESFSVIHLSHIIEHLRDPSTVIEKISRWLHRDGILLLSTPNSRGFFALAYGVEWRLFQKDHLFLFNKCSVGLLLNKSGFYIKRIISWGSIPALTRYKFFKRVCDRLVKWLNLGDVMFIEARHFE